MFCKSIKNNSGYCGGDNQDPGDGNKRKRKGATNSVASVKSADTTLGIFEKQSRIPAPQQQQPPQLLVPRVIRPYGREGSEVAHIWHAVNKKQGLKAKSKDDSNSIAIIRLGFSLPRTNLEHHLVVGVDDIQDLLDCPINFEYGKQFLPDAMIAGFQVTYRGCIVGTRGYVDLGSQSYIRTKRS
jgi:hypothetical protein